MINKDKKMKAVALTQYLPIENTDSFFDTQIETPAAHGRNILVNVLATSINPVDTKVRAPKDKIEEQPRVLGWDAVGIVTAVGDKSQLFNVGDKVFYAGDITRSGSNSEYQLVDERIVGLAPKSLSDEEIAAMPLTSITAWEAIFDRLRIDKQADNSKKSILIINGAGGVGSIAIQIAKQVAGLQVIATASRPETSAWCQTLGADHVINHCEDMVAQLKTLELLHVDYILCLSHTESHFDAMVDLIKPQGSICSIVETSSPLDISRLQSKSATFVWEFMFSRSMFQTEDMIEQHNLLNQLSALLDNGTLKSTLQQTLSPINAENLRAAHALVEQGNMLGKIVISQWH
jgi:alcohol dehydrogenase